MAFKYRNNLVWRDLPDEPPWQTVFQRFTRWARDGTWHRILTALQARVGAQGDLDWLVGVGSGDRGGASGSHFACGAKVPC